MQPAQMAADLTSLTECVALHGSIDTTGDVALDCMQATGRTIHEETLVCMDEDRTSPTHSQTFILAPSRYNVGSSTSLPFLNLQHLR